MSSGLAACLTMPDAEEEIQSSAEAGRPLLQYSSSSAPGAIFGCTSPSESRCASVLQPVLPGARTALLDELEDLRDRGRRFRQPDRDQRVVDFALVGEELRPEANGLQIGANRFDRGDRLLVRSPGLVPAALGLDHAAEAVERLPLLFDEADARGAVERGLKLARRFGQPPHAAKRLASVQQRLHFSSLVRRFARQLSAPRRTPPAPAGGRSGPGRRRCPMLRQALISPSRCCARAKSACAWR